MKTKTSQVNKASAFVKGKTKTVISNVGFYLMLAFDVVFLVLLAIAGYTSGVLAVTVVLLIVEVVSILFLLPVPLLQVGMAQKYAVYAAIFVVMPIVEFSCGTAVRDYGGIMGVYWFIAAARFLIWVVAFFSSRSALGGGACVILSVTFMLLALLGAGTLFQASLRYRPLKYVYSVDYESYIVTGAISGVRDNVKIPSTYKGEPVIGVEIKNAGVMRNLDLPASIKYVTLKSDTLENLTVRGEGVQFDNCEMQALKNLHFTSDAIPANLPFSDKSANEGVAGARIHFTLNAFNAAMRSEELNYMSPNFELDTDSSGSVIYYTACGLSESGVIDGLYEDAVEFDGESISTPELDLEDDGYAFIGWYTSRGYTGNRVQTVRRGEHLKLYAKYLKLYTIRLSNYSGLVTNQLKYHNEMSVTLPEPESRDGYAFCGWYYHGWDSSERVKGADIKSVPTGSSGDKWFVPEYKKLYNITVHDDGGNILVNIPETYHEWSDDIWLPLLGAEKKGYTFMGWYLDPGFTQPESLIPLNAGKDLDIYLKFNKNYTITVNTHGGSAVTLPSYYHKESDTILLPFPTRTGYKFDGWYKSEEYSADGKIESIPKGSEGDLSLHAKWTPITYSIRYDKGKGEGVAMEDTTFTFDEVNRLSECSYTRKGYTFAGWRLSGKVYQPGVEITENFTNVDGAIIPVEAQWTPITYTVKYEAGEGGGGAEMQSSTFTYDSNIRLRACSFTRTGYHFTGWQVGGSTYLANVNLTVNFASEQGAEVMATATWAPNEYRVRYLTGVGGDFTETYTYDSSVTIANCNTIYTGYEFAGWKINETVYQPGNSGVYNFTSEEGGQVYATAQWTPIRYTVKYSTGVSADFTHTYTYNDYITMPKCTDTKEGYTFSGWQIGGQTYQADQSGIFNFSATKNEEVTATAVWKPITYIVKYVEGDGSGSMQNSTFTYGIANRLRECAFTRTGYTFAGWQIGGSTYQPNIDINENFASEQGAEVQATAIWTPVTYTVHYVANGDGVEGTTEDSLFTYDGDNNELRSCGFTRDGYEFVGWSTVPEPDSETVYPAGKITENLSSGGEVTLYAIWRKIEAKE